MGPWGKGPQAVSSHFPLPAPPPKQQAQVTQSWEGLRGGHGQAAGQTPRLLSTATLGCFWPQGKSGGCPPRAVGQRSQDLPFLMLMIRLHQCSSPRDRRGKGQDGRVLGSKGAPGGVGGQSCLAGPSAHVGGGFFLFRIRSSDTWVFNHPAGTSQGLCICYALCPGCPGPPQSHFPG